MIAACTGAPTGAAILAATIEVTSANVGDLAFSVNKLGTSTPLSGSVVSLVNQSGRLVSNPDGDEIVYDSYLDTTDSNGQVTFSDLPLGEYRYQVSAAEHYAQTGQQEVLAQSPGGEGGGNSVSVSLQPDPFTYDWTVTETEIEDTYGITVSIGVDAAVPDPLLLVTPLVFCPGQDGLGFVVANLGAVTMTNIILTPDHEGVAFSPTTVNIGALAPGTAYTGTLSSSGQPDEAASNGFLAVSASYQGPTQTMTYQTANVTARLCVPAGGGSSGDGRWTWTWDEQELVAIGQYEGSHPTFPSNSTPPAPANPREEARLTLSGEATLERQAFLAELRLAGTGGNPVEDIQVDIGVKNEAGLFVVDGFVAIPDVPTGLGTLSPGGDLVQQWELIPGELGITDPAGEVFLVQAQIVYTYSGQTFTTTTVPAPITVLPQPRVRLSYSHNQPDANNEFYLQVRAENRGYGVARNLKLDLSRVNVLPDLDGNSRSLLFDLKRTLLDGATKPAAYILDFGDIQPDQSKTGRWEIELKAGDGSSIQDAWITGFAVTCDHRPYKGHLLSDLLFCGPVNQFFLAGECPFCGLSDKNATVGGPINTANGNYHYSQSAPGIPTIANPLRLAWSFNSLQVGAHPDFAPVTTTLGLAWTHNYDLRLTISDLRLGEGLTGGVTIKAFHGTPLHFEWAKDRYVAAPGVRGMLTRTEVLTNQYVYTLTAVNQAVYVFDDEGQLTAQYDPRGNVTTFTYNGQDHLTRVAEPTSGRYLDFSYDGQGRLETVTDPISRATQFGYDGGGLLTSVTDTRGQVWQYAYTEVITGGYALARVTDPDGRIVEATGFDSLGRAITQTFRGEALALTYHPDGRRAISDALDRETVHIYNSLGLLVGANDSLTQTETFVLDEHYNRTSGEDKAGGVTSQQKTAFGRTIAITDALGQALRFEYDAHNNETKTTDALGNVTQSLHDSQNNLISTTNALSISTFYTYNPYGQITSVTDNSTGQVVFNGYDAFGNHTVLTDALGFATVYEYDTVGRLVKTTDPLGKVTSNEYDAGDNLIRVTENVWLGQPQNYLNEYNIVTEYAYDGAGNQIVITDTLGRVNHNEYESAGRLKRRVQNVHPTISTQNYLNEYNLVTEYGYDVVGNQIAITDTLGRVTRTEYDELNRATRQIENYVDGVYDSAKPDEDIIGRSEYDMNGNLTSLFDISGRETRLEYDALNRLSRLIINYQDGIYTAGAPDEDQVMSYGYDALGRQIALTDTLGRVTRTDYDPLGQVKAVTDTLGGVTTYVYDFANNQTSITDAEGRTTISKQDPLTQAVTINPLGGQRVTIFNEVGNAINVIDANGRTMTNTYDSLYRLTSTTDAENQTMTFTYDALGNRLSVTDAEGRTTSYLYDSLNRIIQTTNPLSGTTINTYDAFGNRLSVTDANGHTTAYQYDKLNRLTRLIDANTLTTTTTYDGLGRQVSVTNGANETTEFEYDGADRLVLTRDELENETHYSYDGVGNRVAMIDAEGVETRYEYDALNRLITVIANYDDGVYTPGTTDQDVRTAYAYDAVGNRLSVTDANTHTATYTYDALNRRIEMRDPLDNVTQYQYDPVGNRAVITDANGDITTFSYDKVNRLTAIDYSDTTPDVTFSYNQVGQRVSMVDGTGTTTYSYDNLDRLTGLQNGAGQVISYTYDAVGNRTGLIYPDGKVVTYTYDSGNRLDDVTDWQNGQYAYTYDGANRLTGLTLPNGVTSGYVYDEAGRLTLLTHNTLTETLASYAYSLDGVGNRTTLTETLLVPDSGVPGAYLESDGLVVLEAENTTQVISNSTHTWQLQTTQNGYTGTGYLQGLPDLDTLYLTPAITDSSQAIYPIDFTTPGTYTIWARGYPTNAAGDSLYVALDGQVVGVTGFSPNSWTWTNQAQAGGVAEVTISQSGLYTLSVVMREDGLRLDRLLLTTDTTYLPTGFGPVESVRQTSQMTGALTTLQRTITYGYDQLYHLTAANYTSGEQYSYAYDPVGNRLQQIIDGDTSTYTYDAANRLASVDGASYTFDDNGNLLTTGAMTNTWDTANRLIETTNAGATLQPIYDGQGNRVAQTSDLTTTSFALDVQGLPEVIYTSEGNAYLHLPGVMMTESATGTVRYLLSDGLGSVRQAVDEDAMVVSYKEFDPYGNLIVNLKS